MSDAPVDQAGIPKMMNDQLPDMDAGTWNSRAPSEVDFWSRWVETSGAKWPAGFKRKTDPEAPLLPEIEDFLSELGAGHSGTVEILDIGSGPLSVVGHLSPKHTVQLTLIDPLAEQYNEILDAAGVDGRLPRPQTGYFETALGQLGANRFDVVWCRNSLDHSLDPLLGLHNLIAMCKTGGGVLLKFHPNEADRGNYGGLHQWNLDKCENAIVLKQKNRELDLTPLLLAQNLLSISISNAGDVEVRLQKVRDPNLSQAMMQAV